MIVSATFALAVGFRITLSMTVLNRATDGHKRIDGSPCLQHR